MPAGRAVLITGRIAFGVLVVRVALALVGADDVNQVFGIVGRVEAVGHLVFQSEEVRRDDAVALPIMLGELS